MGDKAKAQRRHAKTRALQRYDLDLSREDLEELVRQIQLGKAEFILRQSCRVSFFAVELRGQKFPVVYDKQRKTIVTVLPCEGYLDAEGRVIK